MTKDTNILFQNLTSALAYGKDHLDAPTIDGMVKVANTILETMDDALLVKTSYSSGLNKPASVSVCNTANLTLLKTLERKLTQAGLEMDSLRGLDLTYPRFSSEDQKEGWPLMMALVPTKALASKLLDFMIETAQNKDYDYLALQVSWFLEQNIEIDPNQWIHGVKTVRVLDTRSRDLIVQALLHSLTLAPSLQNFYRESQRVNAPYASILALRLRPDTTRDYHAAWESLARTNNAPRHPVFEWLMNSGPSAHSLLLLQSDDLDPTRILAAHEGNPDTLTGRALNLPDVKDWLKGKKEQRQRERGREPGTRRVKPRRQSTTHQA